MNAAVTDLPPLDRAHLVGLNIRRARKLANMRQEDLAQLIGKRRNRLAEWENGYHEPRAETLDAIADATEQPLAFFYADHRHDGAGK